MKRLHISDSEALSGGRGEIYYLHGEVRERSSAFDKKDKKTIELSIPRSLGTMAVFAAFYKEDCTSLLFKAAGELFDSQLGFDTYRISIDEHALDTGLYFFKLSVDAASGLAYAKRCGEKIEFSKRAGDFFQLSVSSFPKSASKKHLGGIIYHVFVDRFSKDENVEVKKGAEIADFTNGIPEYPKYPGAFLKNNSFYGGTLRSAAKKLDYIKSLGTTLIYLSPIFESPSNHKYDTADYTRVDSMFGGDEALKDFITEAKQRGMDVILDGVFNHTGADSVYFNRYGTYDTVGAYQSPYSEFYGWYNFEAFPDKYECWWGIEILPRINTGNKHFEEFILNDVIGKYTKLGIGGFRLDVADELSDDFIKKIKAALADNPDSILFGEVWEDGSNKIAYGKRKTYYLGDELDGVMNYPLREGLIDYLRDGKDEKLRYALTDIIYNAPKHVRNRQMNLLGTHDTPRILTALGGKAADGISNDALAKMRMSEKEREAATELLLCAYTVVATLPGIPSVFYADEVGLEGYSDPFNRMPYPTDISEKILNHYKKIGQIRQKHSVYKEGGYVLLHLSPELLAFSRYNKTHSYITILNNSQDEICVSFSAKAKELISGDNGTQHKILPRSTSIFKAEIGVVETAELLKITRKK